jgi:transposase-like protein
MLLRHYLEQGASSKSALARQLGISRDTIHQWIRASDLDRDLDSAPDAMARDSRGRRSSMRTNRSLKRGSPPIPRSRRCALLDEIRAAGMRAATRN